MIRHRIPDLVLSRIARSLPIRQKGKLRNEVLQQKIGRVLEELCVTILEHDYEKAMASFTTFCLSQNIIPPTQLFLNRFLSHPEVIKILFEAKVRYYEFFLAVVDPIKRIDLSKQLYGGIAEEISYIREMIALSSVDGLEANGLFRDRIHEWALIFDGEKIPYLTKTLLMDQFEKLGVNDDERLFKTLTRLTPLYFLRKMQLPVLPELQRLLKLLPVLEKEAFPLKTLDYGCGAADASILLTKRGHKATICDVVNGNLSTARKRFELRSLEVTCVGASLECPVPSIEGQFDLIIAIEVLEHIRNPLKLLELVYELLGENGMVILGSFPFTDTDTRGDHLKEAVSQRSELCCWINNHLNRVSIYNVGNTFVKK